MIRNTLGALVILLLGMACTSLPPSGYVKHLSSLEDYKPIVAETEDYRFELQFRPVALQVYLAARSLDVDQSELERAFAQNDGFEQYQLKIIPKNPGVKTLLGNPFFEREIEQKLHLELNGTLYQLGEFLYESSHNIKPYYSYLIGFKTGIDQQLGQAISTEHDRKLWIMSDNRHMKENASLLISPEYFSQIPALKI